MKPTRSIISLLSSLLIFSCQDNTLTNELPDDCIDKEAFEDSPHMTKLWTIVIAGTEGIEYYGTFGEDNQPKDSINSYVPDTLVFLAKIAEGYFHKKEETGVLVAKLYNQMRIRYRKQDCGTIKYKIDDTLYASETTYEENGSVHIFQECIQSFLCYY